MTNLGEIESAIAALDSDERKRLRRWLDEFEADEWDRQIERDASAGLLEELAEQALRAHREGTTREL